MSLFLKLFNTTAEYNAYTADTSNFILPNVSCAMDDLTTVHYNPIETRVVAKYNVTNTSSQTQLCSDMSNFSAMEIDGVVQPSVVSAYTFSATGEHTVKYTLTDPTSIGEGAFFFCTSLTSISIPNSVTSISDEAFSNCSSLASIVIPSGVTSIGSYAFYRCSNLTSITIPSGVTSIGSQAFQGCSGLISIEIPDSVTSIGEMAFVGCSSLTSVTIGNSVTSIGNLAFAACSSLANIASNAMTAPTINSDTFQGVKTGGTLTVPSGSSGYDTWMQNANYYLGLYGWTKVEQ